VALRDRTRRGFRNRLRGSSNRRQVGALRKCGIGPPPEMSDITAVHDAATACPWRFDKAVQPERRRRLFLTRGVGAGA
jgi:hypothetical protein